jgi:hypothetical protein
MEKKMKVRLLSCLIIIILIITTLSNASARFDNHIEDTDKIQSNNPTSQPAEITIDINGLYYLRGIDPLNHQDKGSILRNISIENEVTFCGLFILFHFAEQNDYSGIYTINNIYYHIWQKAPGSPFEGEEFDLGYSTLKDHDIFVNESIMINTSNHISVVDGFRLVQAMQFTNPEIAVFEGEKIYDFTIKTIGNGPYIRTYPNQYSFIILNLEDNETLLSLDRDSDYLNDYEELFVYFTNPFDIDTDGDGATDFDETKAGLFGYDYSDPNDPYNTTSFRQLYARSGGEYTGLVNNQIHFDGDAFGGFPPYTWHWDFGDGNYSNQQNPTHSYSVANIYKIKLTVTDNNNDTSFDNTIVAINNINVNLKKPENGLYIRNQRILKIPIPIIIGKIDLEVEASDHLFGIDLVEIYIDDILKATDDTEPYNWKWNEKTFSKHTIKVVVFDKSGNNINKELEVWKYF